jgi:CDGSH-type Zn-finger protein/uncharacterized Fe-S cluster protein YjdI
MEEDIHRYESDEIDVTYDVNRCIHVKACVEGLPGVFDPDSRPWIRPDEADADEVASVITDCPTGALQFERNDGGEEERPPEENTVTVAPDGPLYVHGDVEIVSPEDEVLLEDTRVALCRCGASANKPLCDGSHGDVDFEDGGTIDDCGPVTEDEPDEGGLSVTPNSGGPFKLSGAFGIESADGESSCTGTETALCRCGASGDKPFCDGTHAEVGFSGENEGELHPAGEERVS